MKIYDYIKNYNVTELKTKYLVFYQQIKTANK